MLNYILNYVKSPEETTRWSGRNVEGSAAWLQNMRRGMDAFRTPYSRYNTPCCKMSRDTFWGGNVIIMLSYVKLG